MTPAEWARRSVEVGAFVDARSRRTLARVGVDLTDDGWESANLLPPSPRGRPLDVVKASLVATELKRNFLTSKSRQRLTVVLAGGTVARAWGVVPSRAGSTTVGEVAGKTIVEETVLPDGSRLTVKVIVVYHPSGLSRSWNDQAAVEALGRKVRRVLTRGR